jgi:hypothetical protein
MNNSLGDLYSSYLISSSGQVTCTGLSDLLDNSIVHDKFTQFLNNSELEGNYLWNRVKKKVHILDNLEGSIDRLLIIDDHIEEKPYMQENGLISWHWSHVKKRNVKGINQLSVLYSVADYSIPVGFNFVHKTVEYKKNDKIKYKSPETKNEKYRKLIAQAIINKVGFEYVLSDSWFSSVKNMQFIKKECQKEFIMPIKKNRRIALSKQEAEKGNYQALSELTITDKSTLTVYLKGVNFPLTLVKQVFKNKDESEGILYLVSSKEELDFEQITTLYKKRWKVEEHHKSIKSNLNYSKSPAYKPTTQQNHCVMCLVAFFEWECICKQLKTNHFALKYKIYINALKMAFQQVEQLKQKLNIA